MNFHKKMNSTNETYYSLDYWFDTFGYPKNIDIVSTYIVLPTGLISFALNMLTFLVLRKECFSKSLFFSNMKLYILNGAKRPILTLIHFIYLKIYERKRCLKEMMAFRLYLTIC